MIALDSYWVSLIVAIVGAFLGMVLPYLIKTYEDPETVFDWTYFYTLVVTTVIMAVGLIPATIEPSPQYFVGLFLTGFGLQTVLSKAKVEKPVVIEVVNPTP